MKEEEIIQLTGMVEIKSKALGTTIKIDRLIGKYSRNIEGPTVIFIGGMHGNEPSGVFALHSVLQELNRLNPPLRGELYAFGGNLTALSLGVRYVEKDLNRIWKPGRIREMMAGEDYSNKECADEKEQRELFRALRSAYLGKKHVYIFDLHTTSSESRPFTTIADTLRNRQFALNFPMPVILGIEEQLEGTLLNYINELGPLAVGFEAGQHDAIATIEIHKAVIWLALYHCHCLPKETLPNYNALYRTIAEKSENGSNIYEVRYRHEIDANQGFKMLPGFTNFQKIKRGDVLARSKNGDISSIETGMIFLPLYQNQGNDGFFLVREFLPFWLKVSKFVRTRRLERILHYLPGIRKHPDNNSSLIVNRKIARWYVMEVLHLFGYRRKTTENGKLVVTKRKYDINEPDIIIDS